MIHLTRIKKNTPERGKGIRLAIFQGEGPVGSNEATQANLKKLGEVVKEARAYNAQIISFPELYITGYALNPALVKKLALEINGPVMTRVSEIARENQVAIICPYPELEKKGSENLYFDAIALFDKSGELRQNYRKTHLFGQAERDNFSFGYSDKDPNTNQYPVNDIDGFPVGILNCYEAEFFELSRILAIKGAKLIVIPTAADYFYTLPNGERTKVPYPDVSKNLIPAHAYENNCFISYSNHCGHETIGENSWEYRGNSMIASPHGELLVAARPEETLLIGDIIPDDFGPTHPEGDYLKDRRPELYNDLVK